MANLSVPSFLGRYSLNANLTLKLNPTLPFHQNFLQNLTTAVRTPGRLIKDKLKCAVFIQYVGENRVE
jgi:hypothetical protein